MKTLACLTLTLACTLAQAAPFKVQTYTQGEVNVPYVQSGNARVAQRINTHFFRWTFSISPPRRLGERVTFLTEPDEIGEPPFVYQWSNFTVVRNDDRLLSFTLHGYGCGMGCQKSDQRHSYETATGRAILLEDLLTPGGERSIRTQIRQKHIAALRERIAEQQRLMQAYGTDDVIKEQKRKHSTERFVMYQRCLSEMTPDAPRVPIGFSIARDAVTFFDEDCDRMDDEGLDEIGPVALPLPLAQLKPHLTAYGRWLLLGEGQRPAPPQGIAQQIYSGRIGSFPITLYFGHYAGDGEVYASYFYDRHRKYIELTGTKRGNRIELTEYPDSPARRATIKAVIDGERFTGQWVGSRTLDFEAAP